MPGNYSEREKHGKPSYRVGAGKAQHQLRDRVASDTVASNEDVPDDKRNRTNCH